jgi:hypothetical protein
MKIRALFASNEQLGERAASFGFGLLIWGLVDRPVMIIVGGLIMASGYYLQSRS